MTEPPYSKENPQRPQYMDNLRINWTGSPLFAKKYYLVKANSTLEKLNTLQAEAGVIDLPNINTDVMETLPVARKIKNATIEKLLGITSDPKSKVLDFVNQVARSGGNAAWHADKLFVPDEE